MPATSLALAFTLGAALDANHSRVVGRVTKDLNGLGRSVTDLSKTARQLDEFGKKRDAFLKTAAGVHEASKRLAELKAEMAKAPSPELERRVQAAARAMENAKTRAFDQRRSLTDLKRDLRDAGVDTGRLAQEQARLAQALERTNRLQQAHARLGKAWRDTARSGAVAAGAVYGAGRTIARPVNLAATFEDQVRQIAITGEVAGTAAERQLGQAVLHASEKYHQTTTDINAGVAALVARGADMRTAIGSVDTLTKVATATRASFEDLSSVLFAFQNTLGVKDWQLAFDQMAKAGKLGSFEIKDMARAMPEITGLYKSLGMTGNEAVVSAASRLQIAKFTAADSGQAATNFGNFLRQLTSQRTLKNFEDNGIDLRGRLKDAAAHGVDPIRAAITLIGRQIATASPTVRKTFQHLNADLAKIKDPVERAAEMARRSEQIAAIGQSFGMGELFRDQGAAAYILAELQNSKELERIMGEVRTGQGTIDKDFASQVDLTTAKIGDVASAWSRVGIMIGTTIKPAVDWFLGKVADLGNGIARFAEESPRAFAVVTGALGALVGGTAIASVVRFGRALFSLGGALIGLGGAQAAAGVGVMGRLARLGGSRLLGPLGVVLAAAPNLARAFDSNSGAGARWQAGASATGTLAGGLAGAKLGAVIGTMIAPGLGTAAGGLIGAVIGSVVGEKTLSFVTAKVQEWGPKVIETVTEFGRTVVQWASGLPQQVADAVRSGLQLVVQAGSDLAAGITGGIRSGYEGIKASVTGLATGTVDWFKDKLGIHSPSRVFFGLGQMVGDGAAGGIGASASRVMQAAAGLGLAASVAFQPAGAAGMGGFGFGGSAAPVAAAAPQVNQSITISITQRPGEDAQALAERVAALLRRESRTLAAGALGDWA